MKSSINFLSIAAIAMTLIFTSCKKLTVDNGNDLYSAIANEDATILLSKAGFTTKSQNLVKAIDENYYEAGTMEYIVDGVTEATFDFETGGQGTLNKGGASSTQSLKGQSGKTNYTKVVVSPIVKVTGCKYIVQGIVEYYDQSNNLLATIDFGNGVCDEWATKAFPNNYKPAVTFSQDDWFKK